MSEAKTAALVKFESGLTEEKHNAISARYNTAAEGLSEALEEAKGVEIKGIDDRKGMAAARASRLKLRSIRIGVENARKELKKSALLESKAIDGMANIIKFMVEPVESALKEKEEYAERAERERVAALAESRRAELDAFDIDTSCFDLGAMADDAYETLRATSEAGYRAKVEAEERERARVEEEARKAEEEAAKRREAERIEAERIRAENEKLRKEAEAAAEAQRKAEEEAAKARAKAEKEAAKAKAEAAEVQRKAEAEAARIKAEAEAEERRKAKAEADRITAEREAEQARLAAPDVEKVKAFESVLCGLTIPSVASDEAMKLFERVRTGLNDIVRDCRKVAADMEAKKGKAKQ